MDGKPTGASPVISETTVMLTRSLRPERIGGDRGDRGVGGERRHGGDKGFGGEKRHGEAERSVGSGGERRFFNPGSDRYPTIKKSSGLVCIHCGEIGHSKQRCYEIIGYPDWWDFQKKPRKNFRKNMVNLTEVDPRQPTANVVHPGKIGKNSALSVIAKNSAWIIDTGASDHMTRDSGNLKFPKPSSQSVICTANGSTSLITGEGSVTLTESLTLDTVLVVPSLSYNLLSVSQITLTLICTVIFWPLFCVFQDILTRKILGYGVRCGHLYYLELTEKGGIKIQSGTSGNQ